MNHSDMKIGIVVARFNEVITSKLAQGAKNLLLGVVTANRRNFPDHVL